MPNTNNATNPMNFKSHSLVLGTAAIGIAAPMTIIAMMLWSTDGNGNQAPALAVQTLLIPFTTLLACGKSGLNPGLIFVFSFLQNAILGGAYYATQQILGKKLAVIAIILLYVLLVICSTILLVRHGQFVPLISPNDGSIN